MSNSEKVNFYSKMQIDGMLAGSRAALREVQAHPGDPPAEAQDLLRRNAETAQGQLPFWSPEACRLRARFDPDPARDSTIRQDWRERLHRFSSEQLALAARQAAADSSLPLAAAILEEVSSRSNLPMGDARKLPRNQVVEMRQILDAVETDAGPVGEALRKVILCREEARVLSSGSKPGGGFEKIRLGLLKQQLDQ